jgi:hypothetical protein
MSAGPDYCWHDEPKVVHSPDLIPTGPVIKFKWPDTLNIPILTSLSFSVVLRLRRVITAGMMNQKLFTVQDASETKNDTK